MILKKFKLEVMKLTLKSYVGVLNDTWLNKRSLRAGVYKNIYHAYIFGGIVRFCKIYLSIINTVFKQLKRKTIIVNAFNQGAAIIFRIIRLLSKEFYNMYSLNLFFLKCTSKISLFKNLSISINTLSKYFFDTVFFILITCFVIIICICIIC